MGYLEALRADIKESMGNDFGGLNDFGLLRVIDAKINNMSTVEMLERIDAIDEQNLKGF